MTVHGELRSGARANLLMGVGSNRVDVHRACAAAERSLERRAEPLQRAVPPARRSIRTRSPTIAWRNLVLNSAHDSSCACSADEVVDQVLVRYAEARQIGDGLDARRGAGARRAGRRARGRDGRREPDRARAQPGSSRSRCPGAGRCTCVDARRRRPPDAAVGEIGGEAYADDGHRPEGALGARPDARHRVRRARRSRRTRSSTAETADVHDDRAARSRRRATTRRDLVGAARATARARRPTAAPCACGCSRRRCAACCSTPARSTGFGWACFTRGRTAKRRRRSGHRDRHDARERAPARRGRRARRARTRSTTDDGLRVAGLGRLVDGGDGGDTYNYSPPAADRVVDTPDAVRVTDARGRSGARPRADRRRLHVARVRAIGDDRSCSARSDETVRGHRPHHARAARGRALPARRARARQPRARPPAARALPAARAGRRAPTPSARSPSCTAGSRPRAACTSTGCRRSRRAGSSTRRTATVGLALVHDGLLEYEVVDDGRELALTLLRAVGYLSRTEPPLRPNPAGPADARSTGAQLPGAQRAEYAVLLHRGDWRAGRLLRRGRRVRSCRSNAHARPARHARRAGRERHRAARRRRRGVGRAARSPAGSCVRVFRTEPDAGPVTDRARGRARPRLGRRPPRPPRRPLRRHRRRSAPGRSAPSNSTD